MTTLGTRHLLITALFGALALVALSLPAAAQQTKPNIPGAADPTRHGRDEHHVHVEAFPVAPASPRPLLREHIPGLDKGMQDLSPFFRDTILNLHGRSFYFNRQTINNTANEALALGGWLEYKSGWLLDTFAIGLTGYTSQPLYAPDGRDGTLLLATGQDGITVLGEAYAKLRYKEYAVLTGGRQLIDQGYVNREDNRMIPNTFEALTLGGKFGPFQYDVGYLWTIKPRDENQFLKMSEQAGVKDGNDGLLLTSLTVTPLKDLTAYFANYWVDDTFNTAYANPEYTFRLAQDLGVSLGAQYTDQRNTGRDLLGTFNTWNVGARVQLAWRGLSLIGAMSATGEQASLRTPYGLWPGYLQLLETAFNRANEKAFGFGTRVDFSKDLLPFRVPGLSVLLFYAQGIDRRDPSTGADQPTTHEGNLDIIYKIPAVRNLSFRFRNGYTAAGGDRVQTQFRMILNYELNLL